MPYSGSPPRAFTPLISFIPGQTPPESCHPPPEPPIHSPKIARAATSLLSFSSSCPVRDLVCPDALMHTDIKEANKLVETANLEPFGIPLTCETISIP